MANQIGQLASGIVQWDFDYITGVEAATELQKVSGWLLTNLGQLNTLLYTTFYSGTLNLETGYATGNHLKQEEKAIYTQVYLQDYYTKQARLSLRSFVNTSTSSSSVEMTPWTTLREGDTTIQRDAIKVTASARTEASRTFKNLAAAAESKLQDLVYRYNYYQGAPRQVAGSDGN
jgi:hypothetical protein